ENLVRDFPRAPEHLRGLLSLHGHLGWMRDGTRLYLLTQKSVQQELKLSEEQVQKVAEVANRLRETFWDPRNLSPDGMRARVEELQAQQEALVKALTPPQAERLRQITWQQQGTGALSDPAVAEALGLSDDQKQRIQTIQNEARSALRDNFRPEGWKKLEGIWKGAEEKLLQVLTAQQQT